MEDNRARFVQFVREFDLGVASTWKQKALRQQVTYRGPGATWGDVGRRLVLDRWLIPYKWCNSVADVYNDTSAKYPRNMQPCY